MKADTIPVRAIPRLLVEAVMEATPLPRPPEFGGEPLSLDRLESLGKKARAAWDRFLAEANEAMVRRNDALFKLLMLRGVALEVPPLAEWAGDLAEAGIVDGAVSPGTAKLLYLDHLLPRADDKLALLVRVMEVSGLQAGAVDAVRGLFRDALAEARAGQKGS